MITTMMALALAAPMPEGEALQSEIERLDAQLFWNAFEGCRPDKVAPLIDEDYRMVHDLVGIASDSKADFIAGMRRNCEGRSPGAANAGYKNRRRLTPGSRTIKALGDWGALEEAHHQFYERQDGQWVLTGGGRYLHIWRWTGETFLLNETLSLDHGPAPSYPPAHTTEGS